MNSVVSAAIIEGNLIIGLSDGSIINCGYVQGPQGLSGPQGPMGSTGDRGTDGNTIITVGGTPGNDIGRDGDYAIDNINWRVYGPKAGGVWGKANEMLPGPENILENGRNAGMTGGGGAGGGGGGGDGSGVTFGPLFPTIKSTGHQHVMSDTYYEYVWTGGVWIQIVSPGGGGGSMTLGGLSDVTLVDTKENEVLLATDSGTWENNNTIEGGSY